MKTIVITKKHLLTGCVCVFTALLCIFGSMGAFAASDKKLPIYCVDCEKKQIAISFDAAWGNDDTETLIKILDEYKVPATFFVVGAWVDKYPESVKQLSDAGHQVQNHSNTHPYMTKLSSEQMKNEIETCNKKIAAITGKTPTLIRFPYGDYNNAAVTQTHELNMNCVQWSVDSLDWQDSATPESIYKRVTSKVEPGSIVLFHNDAEHTPEALPNILKTLKDEGYEFVFISDLIMKDNYTIDHAGKQCKIK
ncbi:MAG: polysaccharide deacetylase family protein [Clostridiales bacterium]|nr:polysaccharide deacetylase family protein [Candidatus Equinaster intestinalis]